MGRICLVKDCRDLTPISLYLAGSENGEVLLSGEKLDPRGDLGMGRKVRLSA